MKKWMILTGILLVLLTGCSRQEKRPYQYMDYTLFDTVTTIVGYGDSQEEFTREAENICRELAVYHRLFDIYQEYPGMNNLKTVNDQAGIAPVEVDPRILDLMKDCRDYRVITGEKVNVAMGSVLKLWHEARSFGIDHPEEAKLPEETALRKAAEHCDFGDIVMDPEQKTLFLRDPQLQLDLGAVAKGWAVEQVSHLAPEGMLISVGGNVCATGPKPDGSPWVVGIQNPDGEGYLATVALYKGSAVTSGDYQRYFEVDGERYHHIIDPETLYPSRYWRSVTVLCEDSGLADALSTALFLLPQQEGQSLLSTVGAEALWMDGEGNQFRSPGFPK